MVIMILNIVSVPKFSAALVLIVLLAAESRQEEVKYARGGKSLTLECFDDQPEEGQIEDFKWKIDNVLPIDENDITAYEDFDHGPKRGDLVIRKLPSNYRKLTCTAKLKGHEEFVVQKQYLIEIIRDPQITISSGDDDLNGLSVTANEPRTFTCETKDGNPPFTSITIFVDGKTVDSSEDDVRLSTNLTLTEEDNGKLFLCQVGSSLIPDKFNKTAPLNVTFPPRLLGSEFEHNITNEALSLTVTYQANPTPTSVDWTSNSSKIDDEHLSIPIKSKPDTFSSSVVVIEADLQNTKISFFLDVTNSQGSFNESFFWTGSVPEEENGDSDSWALYVGIATGVSILILFIVGGVVFRKRIKALVSRGYEKQPTNDSNPDNAAERIML